MRSLRSIPVQLLLFFGTTAIAQTSLEAPNETVTAEELVVVCTFCHGDSLQGNDRRDGPALAGLEAWYLELQMQNYRKGIRGNRAEDVPGQVMYFSRGMLRNDETIKNLARYISTLEPGKPMAPNGIGERPYLWDSPYAGLDPSISGDSEEGKKTYSSVCTACHGPNGQGIEVLGSANLTYLSEIYLARQLMYFRDGIRGSHPEDTRGQQMAAIAKTLTDDQSIADVVAYISEL
jgi:cytochrome c553